MKIHTLKGYIQNIFLVEYDDKLLLLDGCGRADVDVVCQFIDRELNRPLNDLKLILVTHMHPDHAGGAHRLRALTDAKIACHPLAPNWYAGLLGRIAHLIDIILLHWVAKKIGRKNKRSWFSPILRPDSILQDNSPVPGFEDWQVIYTPGHTNHDLSLYHQEQQKLYVADLIVRVKGRYHPPFPVYHPNQYKRSLLKLLDLQSPTLLFAHVNTKQLTTAEIHNIIAIAPRKPSSYIGSIKNRIYRAFNNR